MRNTSDQLAANLDPLQVNIDTRLYSVWDLVMLIERKKLCLSPALTPWSHQKQSRFIESLLVQIPVQSFYFYFNEEDVLEVWDGNKRLDALYNFIQAQITDLRHLDYVIEQEGGRFASLPPYMKRRLEESSLTVQVLRQGTPFEICENIFGRLRNGKSLADSPYFLQKLIEQGFWERLEIKKNIRQKLVLRFWECYLNDFAPEKKSSSGTRHIEVFQRAQNEQKQFFIKFETWFFETHAMRGNSFFTNPNTKRLDLDVFELSLLGTYKNY